MPATATSRLEGITTSVAVKPPCVAATSANITLSGLQTIGAVALAEGDRVLVRAQTSSVDNGIYNASTSDWTRAKDFDGNRDVVHGTIVLVHTAATDGAIYEVTSANPITIGTSAITFNLRDDPAITYSQTQAEINALVTPVNTGYAPGHVDRYATNTVPGTTDMTAAFNAAFKVAKTSGHDVVYGETWPYRVTAPINATQAAFADNYGYAVRNVGQMVAITENAPAYPSILADHTGHVFDCSGAQGIHWYDVTVGTPLGAASPKTCWFMARNSLGSSNSQRWFNCRVRGSFSEAVLYNYGGETCQYTGNLWYNVHGGANAKVCVLSAFNIRNLSSTFITIATGQQSMIDHEFIGGQYVNVSHHANADAFHLDTVTAFKMIHTWMACADGTGGGRSLFWVDTTHAQSSNGVLIGVTGENSSPGQNAYGFYGGDTASIITSWTILGCRFPNGTKLLKTAAGVDFGGLIVMGTNNGSIGGGVDIGGALTSSYTDNQCGGVTAGSFGENNVDLMSRVVEVSGEARLTLRDTAAAADNKNWMIRSTGTDLIFSGWNDALSVAISPLQLGRVGTGTPKVGFQGTAPVAKPTVTGSRGANAALASLLTALAAYGLIIDSSS